MLRIIRLGNSISNLYDVDTDCEFEPGMIAQHYKRGDKSVCGVSDGSLPFGIIDDFRKNNFITTESNEHVVADASVVDVKDGKLITPVDIKFQLKQSDIIASTFEVVTKPINVSLIQKTGVVIFPAGTQLNFDANKDGFIDSISMYVRYFYKKQIPNYYTSVTNGKITVWSSNHGMFETDQFETNVDYELHKHINLFVSSNGKLTSFQLHSSQQPFGKIIYPPTNNRPILTFLMF
jgi:hypothetical protein